MATEEQLLVHASFLGQRPIRRPPHQPALFHREPGLEREAHWTHRLRGDLLVKIQMGIPQEGW